MSRWVHSACMVHWCVSELMHNGDTRHASLSPQR